MACTCGQCTPTVKVCTQTSVVEVDNSVPNCENNIYTDCIIHEAAIAYLGLAANSTSTEIINALVLSLTDSRNRITALEEYNIANP